MTVREACSSVAEGADLVEPLLSAIGVGCYAAHVAKRIKKPDDPLKLVIVRDMWLTGFDAPSLHTMYVDKPMKGHGLMQAIARVNRVFRDKPAGLVVDYIGIAQNLKSALGQYSSGDREQVGIDEADAVRVLLEKYEIVRSMFRPDTKGGFDYRSRSRDSRPDSIAARSFSVRLCDSAAAILDLIRCKSSCTSLSSSLNRYCILVRAGAKRFAFANVAGNLLTSAPSISSGSRPTPG